jgi:hypothetical protein
VAKKPKTSWKYFHHPFKEPFFVVLGGRILPLQVNLPNSTQHKVTKQGGLAKVCYWVIRSNCERSHSPGYEEKKNIMGFIQNTCYKIMSHPFCLFIVEVPIMVSF